MRETRAWSRRALVAGGSASLAASWAFPARAHPDHVSIARADHRPAKRCLELALRCKPEDLEAICSVRMGVKVAFGRPDFGAIATHYLREVFILRGPKREKLRAMTWAGGELERGYAWLYLKVPTVVAPGRPELSRRLAGYHLENRLFFSFVPGQINSLILKRGSLEQSFHFTQMSPSARIR